MAVTISVVVIARNEEAAIGRCLDSVQKALGKIPHEILLVDSASEDGTVAVASRYPVRILQITDASVISPAAGRYIGTSKARGDSLLFLDGDMVLHPGWVERALTFFSDPAVGGVGGEIAWVYPGEEIPSNTPPPKDKGVAEYLGGSALYRREAIHAAGTFNPFLKGEEEREVGYRITQAGYVLRSIGGVMAFHLAKARTIEERLEKAGYFMGVGQILRRYGRERISFALLKDNVLRCCAMVLVALSPLLCVLLLLVYPVALALLAGACGAAFGALMLLKGPRRLGLALKAEGAAWRAIVRGWRRGLPAAGEFPMKSVREREAPRSPVSA